MILDICGGQAGVVSEALAELPARNPVKLRLARIAARVGCCHLKRKRSRKCCSPGHAGQQKGDEFSVTPPSYRFDIAIEEDLIEEIARVHGYEQI